MKFNEFMAKVRYLDKICARWMLRHFYIIFFEFVLVIIFFMFLLNTFHSLDLAARASHQDITAQLLSQKSINNLLITILVLLNSFWMLYIFNEITRIRVVLKEISYNLFRIKQNN